MVCVFENEELLDKSRHMKSLFAKAMTLIQNEFSGDVFHNLLIFVCKILVAS